MAQFLQHNASWISLRVEGLDTSSSMSMRTQSHPLDSSVNRPRVEWDPQHTSTRRLVKRPCVGTVVVVHSAGRLVRFSRTPNLWAINESSWAYDGPVENPKSSNHFLSSSLRLIGGFCHVATMKMQTGRLFLS